MLTLDRGLRIHFVGIGGSGLSAIARLLKGWGYLVTGSDQTRSELTDALVAEGIPVEIGHRSEHVLGHLGAGGAADTLVVVSSAVPDDNPEVAAARQNGLAVVKRRELLEALTRERLTVAVAGAHGKTTTTAMIAWILVEAGQKPSFVVGGVLQNLGTNARAGEGRVLVIEADEYDRAFLGLWPEVAVITSLEHDHPDCYPAFSDMEEAFAEFASRAYAGGQLIVCAEDPGARLLAEKVASRPVEGEPPRESRTVTYGLGGGCAWQAEEVQLNGCPVFKVRAGGRRMGQCAIQLPGLHNVLNALAALAATAAVGVGFEAAASALTRFRGTARRFEVKGQAGGITVVDDYAHHPTEIRATLAAARSKYSGRSLWVVFQPHTFSRTAAFLDGFAGALADADHVLITPIFAAREQDMRQVSGADIVARMHALGRQEAHYVDSVGDAAGWLLERVRPGAVVLTLGAGDGYRIGEQVLNHLREHGAGSDSQADGDAEPGAQWPTQAA